MVGYKSLIAWQLASQLNEDVLEATDDISDRRTWAVLDQLRRAVISTDVNIVEGYSLGTRNLYRRHLRIAYGSATEAYRLLEIARKRSYIDETTCASLLELSNRTVRVLYALLRSNRLAVRRGR